MNMKFGRTWLMLALALVMILSVTGGTIAWFTDSVESSGNTIQAGNLNVKLYVDDTEVTEENNLPLFGSDLLWEPGFVAYKKVKIENAGNLAFNYSFGINPSSIISEGANLADVIEVYAFDEVPTREAVNATTSVGTLTTIGAGDNNVFTGTLLPTTGSANVNEADTNPKGSVEKYIVLKMQESAGNEYQNSSLSNLAIKLVATQYTYEKDSFDHNYDENAGDNSAPSDLPEAKVEKLPKDQLSREYLKVTDWNNLGNNMNNPAETVELATGYKFTATQTPEDALQNPYWYYNADFAVSTSKPIPAGMIGLAGEYGGFNFAFDVDQNLIEMIEGEGVASLPAGKEFRLLQPFRAINYYEVCRDVKEFVCGLYVCTTDEAALAALNGTTITVNLNLYETEFNPSGEASPNEVLKGKCYPIGTYTYTFGADE